ncbi:MAG: class I SAM-dependent rRNA methyltransferase [Gammaproteobacteria bacterium]|nr:class I SAM-dependent rRNA methyltransferase [Gammaproteobacteria bacterium]
MRYPPLKLRKNEDRRLRAGHLWVFSNEVDTHATPLKSFAPGQCAVITNHIGTTIGLAYVNPASLICARIISYNIKQLFDVIFFKRRLEQAFLLRSRLFAQPYYRLVYSESDLLPGLIIDRFNDTLVLQISTAGMEQKQAEILEAVDNIFSPAHIILNNKTRSRLLEGLDTFVDTIKGAPLETLPVIENNVHFEVSALAGQKTGWFYDHRLNRHRMQHYVNGMNVLDVFSYTGGWGIQAAAAGAKKVHCIESSNQACQQLLQNAERNKTQDRINIINADAFDTLAQLRQAKNRFDVIIIDPPAFIKRKKDIKQGIIAYQRINKAAMQLLSNNGILISASCSFHLSREQHLKILRDGAKQIKMQLQVIEQGHASPDHPTHPAIPETNYLSTYTVRLLT